MKNRPPLPAISYLGVLGGDVVKGLGLGCALHVLDRQRDRVQHDRVPLRNLGQEREGEREVIQETEKARRRNSGER